MVILGVLLLCGCGPNKNKGSSARPQLSEKSAVEDNLSQNKNKQSSLQAQQHKLVENQQEKVKAKEIEVANVPSVGEKKSPEQITDNIPKAQRTKSVVEIKENMFLTQIDDIFLNVKDYQDKTIVVQGMYSTSKDLSGRSVRFVYRRGPGCCGNDGWGGFLLNYSGVLPKDNDWIEVQGTPELVENGNFTDLYLNVISIKVLQTRGAEFVNR